MSRGKFSCLLGLSFFLSSSMVFACSCVGCSSSSTARPKFQTFSFADDNTGQTSQAGHKGGRGRDTFFKFLETNFVCFSFKFAFEVVLQDASSAYL